MTESSGSSTNEDRLQYFYLNLVGQLVIVHTVDGAATEGIFTSRADEDASSDKAGILLLHARRLQSKVHGAKDTSDITEALLIPFKHIMYMEANRVTFRVKTPGSGNVGKFNGEQALKPFSWAEESPDINQQLEALDDEKHVVGGWDQFEANSKQFNVKSTYDEKIYTTTIDYSKITAEQKARADMIAREIESSPSRGVQHATERFEDMRNVDVDDSLMYSDVQRDGNALDGGKGKTPYIPPGQHRKFVEPVVQQPVAAPGKAGPAQAGKGFPAASAAAATTTNVAGNRAGQQQQAGPQKQQQPQGQQQAPESAQGAVGLRAGQQGNGGPQKQGMQAGAQKQQQYGSGAGQSSSGENVAPASIEGNVKADGPAFNPAATPFIPPTAEAQHIMDTYIQSKHCRDLLTIIAAAIESKPTGYECMPDWPGDGLVYDLDDSSYSRDSWHDHLDPPEGLRKGQEMPHGMDMIPRQLGPQQQMMQQPPPPSMQHNMPMQPMHNSAVMGQGGAYMHQQQQQQQQPHMMHTQYIQPQFSGAGAAPQHQGIPDSQGHPPGGMQGVKNYGMGGNPRHTNYQGNMQFQQRPQPHIQTQQSQGGNGYGFPRSQQQGIAGQGNFPNQHYAHQGMQSMQQNPPAGGYNQMHMHAQMQHLESPPPVSQMPQHHQHQQQMQQQLPPQQQQQQQQQLPEEKSMNSMNAYPDNATVGKSPAMRGPGSKGSVQPQQPVSATPAPVTAADDSATRAVADHKPTLTRGRGAARRVDPTPQPAEPVQSATTGAKKRGGK